MSKGLRHPDKIIPWQLQTTQLGPRGTVSTTRLPLDIVLTAWCSLHTVNTIIPTPLAVTEFPSSGVTVNTRFLGIAIPVGHTEVTVTRMDCSCCWRFWLLSYLQVTVMLLVPLSTDTSRSVAADSKGSILSGEPLRWPAQLGVVSWIQYAWQGLRESKTTLGWFVWKVLNRFLCELRK